MFVKNINGNQIVAANKYTTDDGYVINNFIKYLEAMLELELIDKMYGFEYVEDIIIEDKNKIRKLEEENAQLKSDLEELSLHTIEGNIDSDFRLSLLEINTMSLE